MKSILLIVSILCLSCATWKPTAQAIAVDCAVPELTLAITNLEPIAAAILVAEPPAAVARARTWMAKSGTILKGTP